MQQSPSQRFKANNKDVAVLADIVDNESFRRAVDAAILQINFEMSSTGQPDAMRAYYRMEGANMLVKKLHELSDIPKPIASTRTQNLNWQVLETNPVPQASLSLTAIQKPQPKRTRK